MTYDYINFTCQLSNSPGNYETISECQTAVNNGTAKLVLKLSPMWSANKKVSYPMDITKLGDGYQQTICQGLEKNVVWSITSPPMSELRMNQLLSNLRAIAASSFVWSPNDGIIPYAEYTCDEWQKSYIGVNKYQVSTTFQSSTVSVQGLGAIARILFPDGATTDFINTPITVEETFTGTTCETVLTFEIDGDYTEAGEPFSGIHYISLGVEKWPYGGYRIEGGNLEVFVCVDGVMSWVSPYNTLTRSYSEVRSVRELTSFLSITVEDSNGLIVHDESYEKPTDLDWADFRAIIQYI